MSEMRKNTSIAVIIPALDEEKAIGLVIREIPDWVDDIVVVDNGSTDSTSRTARSCGARVFLQPRKGYGAACLTGMAELGAPDIVVFLDGDYSDYPQQMDRLVDPIIERRADLVIGSRTRGRREPGALTPQARFGNWLSCFLIRSIWRERFTDLGPFRAISLTALRKLRMRDKNYGWTVEMQIKAAVEGLRCLEVPVDYRLRIGESIVSGTFKGVVMAGFKILFTIFRHALETRGYPEPPKR